MSCFKCGESLVKAVLSFSKHFILFSLYRCPDLGPHWASGRCSHGGGGGGGISKGVHWPLWSSCETRSRNRSAPKSRISCIHQNQITHPSFDFPTGLTLMSLPELAGLPLQTLTQAGRKSSTQLSTFTCLQPVWLCHSLLLGEPPLKLCR